MNNILENFPWLFFCLFIFLGYMLIDSKEPKWKIIRNFILIFLVCMGLTEFWMLFGIGWIIFFVFIIIERNNLNFYFIRGSNSTISILWGVVLGIIYYFLILLVRNPEMDIQSNLLSVPFFQVKFLFLFIGLIIIWGVSVGEELIFRGLILGYANHNKKSFILFNITQSLIFFIGHISQGLKFASLTMVFALCLGYLVWKYKNLFGSLVAHTMANILIWLTFSVK